jgi:hypothetical protein
MPPITPSLTESHCLPADASSKSTNGLLIGSAAIPMDTEPNKRVKIGSIATEFELIVFISISFQLGFSI